MAMQMPKGALLATAMFLATALPAGAAEVLYDNGAPNGFAGNETTAWVQAQDFSFSAPTTVGGAGVYLGGFGGIGAWDGGFQYWIFADGGGRPGTQLQFGVVTPAVTDSGIPWGFGGNAYLFSFDFTTPFEAAQGPVYWLGIHAGQQGDFVGDGIYWVTTAPNLTTRGHESQSGTFDNWANNGGEHAFFLTGVREVSVPEPSALALLGFALLGLAGFRRTARGDAAPG